MKSIIFLVIGAYLLFSVIDALVLEKRDNPAVVGFPLRRAAGTSASKLRRRKQQLSSPLINQEQTWYVELRLGSPQQTISVELDTGSSDLVVETDSSDFCQFEPANCKRHGTYNANSSYSYSYVNSNLNIEYGGGDSATGDFATDTLFMAGATIQGIEFGIMYVTNVREGVLGLGYTTNEVLQPNYPNLLAQLVGQNIIQSNSYSVWLNSDQGTGGTLLFGGVDSSKYSGDLVPMPFVPAPGETTIKEFYVTVQEVHMSNGAGTAKIPLSEEPLSFPAILDTGSSYLTLPENIVQAIHSTLVVDGSENPAIVDCALKGSTLEVNVVFQGITISLGLNQLVIPYQYSTTKCVLGIEASSNAILGDTFLSSVYVVYDLDNNEASIAQAVFNVGSEANLLQIGKGAG